MTSALWTSPSMGTRKHQLKGLFKLDRAMCCSWLRPAGAGGYMHSVFASLVDRVAEPECVASLVFGQAVVALGSRVGVARQDACFDGRPPGLDGGGQAVCLGCVGRGCVLVEAVQAGPDDVAFGVGPGQGEQGAESSLTV
jgi:hypothetical protein